MESLPDDLLLRIFTLRKEEFTRIRIESAGLTAFWDILKIKDSNFNLEKKRERSLGIKFKLQKQNPTSLDESMYGGEPHYSLPLQWK